MSKSTDRETEKKRDAALARALSTPHKPHVAKKATKRGLSKKAPKGDNPSLEQRILTFTDEIRVFVSGLLRELEQPLQPLSKE